MLLPRLRKISRAGLAFGLLCLVLLGLFLVPQPAAQAGVGERPLWQDDGYPPPPEEVTQPPDEGYPPPEGEATQSPTLTPPQPPTEAPVDQTSIPGTETAAPTPTVLSPTVPSPTAPATTTSTVVPQASPEVEQEDEPERFQLDWGLFWIGFAVPILAGSGVVLYLLDRRPDLFRPRAKP